MVHSLVTHHSRCPSPRCCGPGGTAPRGPLKLPVSGVMLRGHRGLCTSDPQTGLISAPKTPGLHRSPAPPAKEKEAAFCRAEALAVGFQGAGWGPRVRGGAPSWQTRPISTGSFHQRAVVLAWMATQGWPHRNRTAHCPQRPPCWAPGCTWCPRPYPSRTHRGMPGLLPIPPTASRFSAFPKPHSQDRRRGRSPIGLTAGLALLKLCPAAGRLRTGHHGPLSLSFLSCPSAPRMAGQ